MAPMKEAIVDKEGTLRLGYWKGNEALKGKAVPVKTPTLGKPLALLNHSFNVKKGFVLEGKIKLPQKGEKQLPGIYLESGEKRPTVLQATAKGTSRMERPKRMAPISNCENRKLSGVGRGKWIAK